MNGDRCTVDGGLYTVNALKKCLNQTKEYDLSVAQSFLSRDLISILLEFEIEKKSLDCGTKRRRVLLVFEKDLMTLLFIKT